MPAFAGVIPSFNVNTSSAESNFSLLYAANAGKDFYYPLLKEERKWIEIRTKELERRKGKEKSGEIVGQFEIYLSKQLLFSGNLYKL